MKKVLHIFNHYLPQTETWAYQLISHTPECEQHIAAKVYLDVMPGAEIFQFMDNPQSSLEALDQETDWKKNIFKKAFIRASKGLTKSFDEQLREYVHKNKIDIVHAHFANVGWEVQKALKEESIPIVVSFYGWDYEMLPHVKPEWKARYKEMFDRVDLILTEGAHGKAVLVSKGCTEYKVKVQKLGIEKTLIKRNKRNKEFGELSLIQIASFTEKKGQLYSVKAFGQALQECPNMRLTLIGDNREERYRAKVLEHIAENDLQGHITIRDFIPYTALANELSKHHVFIHPSCYAQNKNCEGGAPTIIFNAAGSGMPTIATTHCDIPSLVIDRKTGLLTKEKNTAHLANSIRAFYKMDKHAYEEFALASHEHIAGNYCIEDNAKELAVCYDDLLKSSS